MNSIHPFLRGALALAPLRPAFFLQGALDTGNRTVRRWLAAEEAPPLGIAEKMVILLRDRAKECEAADLVMEALIATGSLRQSEKVEPSSMERTSAPAAHVERAHRKRLGLDYEGD